ncbi:MAG: AAA family ATPase, partial [Nitrosopumilaceae archaeon]
MGTKAGGESHGSILLSGDPGIGKTTVVSALARLFGMEIMLIEVPHITEEHIINIPFIVFNPLTHTEKTGTTQITPDYRIVLSQSNLYSLIRKAKKVPDGAYIQNIYSAPKDVINTFEYFGGSQTKVPDVFQQARNNYDVILFLDEYFRQTSPRIRNMLRGILNNRIGMHEIPSNVYIVYASNMKDQGLEDIGQNPQFTQIKMHSPDKEEWFDWLIAKFEKDEHVKLKPAIISHFRKILKTEDLSHDDVVNEVRTSPRRWEQLLLYINASLPVKDEDEAKGLLTNVKTNFYNYISHEHSDLAKKVMNAVVKLIKVTSNLEVQASTVHESHEWRNALSHQIAIKMKLGEHRKYIPVVSGAPGIGKTSNAIVAAEDNNLRFIDIDVSELSAEDVIGLPLPGKSEDGEEMATTFSTPKLYQQILNKIKITEEHYIAKLRKDPATAEAKIKEYQNQRWKYLIFFDELNRTDDKTFNSLRRILLEKNFGPSGDKSGSLLSLPPESIIIAAINPHDINTVEFTHHFKDVLDISHATSSWKKTLDLMRNKGLSGVVKEAKDISINVISTFANKFRTKSSDIDKELQPFHLDLHTDFYFSPREYMDLFTTLAGRINPIMQEIQKTDFNAEPDKTTT